MLFRSAQLGNLRVLRNTRQPVPNDIVTAQMVLDTERIAAKHGDCEVEVVIPATEMAVALLVAEMWKLLRALARMLQLSEERFGVRGHGRQSKSDYADSVVILCRQRVAMALSQCGDHTDGDARNKTANKMLKELHTLLGRVDIRKDSSPGIGLAKLFCETVTGILSMDSTEAERQECLDTWRARSAILSKGR